jgi:hypothetical protein
MSLVRSRRGCLCCPASALPPKVAVVPPASMSASGQKLTLVPSLHEGSLEPGGFARSKKALASLLETATMRTAKLMQTEDDEKHRR